MEESVKGAVSSIEDNYPEYVEQEYGYAYEVDDVMSQNALGRHDELLRATPERLEELALDSLDDFELWAVARAWGRHGEFDRFVELCQTVLSSDSAHPVVIYSEISRGLAHALASEEQFDQARERLETHLQEWEGDVQARQLSGVIDLLDDPSDDDKLRALVEEYPADAELCFEIAEDLWRFERNEAAAEWLEKARTTARESGDHAALVDIELLAGRL